MSDIQIRPVYSIPLQGSSGFIQLDNRLEAEQFTTQDLERSGLTLEDMGIRPATHLDSNYSSQYYLPYFTPDGQVIVDQDGVIKMYRLRGELTAKGKSEKRGKYNSPGRESVGELSNIPYLHPKIRDVYAGSEEKILAICEGEKKAAALMKYGGVASIGLGGKDMWHRKGEQTKLHEWIQYIIDELKPSKIMVVPDGDVRKFHIAQSFGSLARLLQAEGYTVHMPLLPNLDDKVDDLIVGDWQGEDIAQKLLDLEPVHDFVETMSRLRDEYHLQTVQRGDRVTVPVNEANLMLLIANHPSFDGLWFNEDTQRVILGDRELDDVEVTGVLAMIQRSFSMPTCKRGTVRDAMDRVARRDKARSPWKEYLINLEWDGESRLENWMVEYCNAKDTAMCREGGVKWLVGSVGRSLDPGCKMDYMVVTTGAQGIGKSSLPNILFGDERVRSISNHLRDTDLYTVLHGSVCANWEELSAMSNYELEHFKTIISETHDNFRRKYARSDETRARDFVMYGSTNDTGFLPADATGHRRYVVVRLGQVEFERLGSIKDQLWAEAVHLYRSGEVDFSQVDAAKHQGAEYVVEGEDYGVFFDAVLQDYEMATATVKHGNGVNPSCGEVKDGWFCGTLGDWRELASLPLPRGRAGQQFTALLRMKGWEMREQQRVNGRKRSKVWACPEGLLQ